jgi:hypothetical protein
MLTETFHGIYAGLVEFCAYGISLSNFQWFDEWIEKGLLKSNVMVIPKVMSDESCEDLFKFCILWHSLTSQGETELAFSTGQINIVFSWVKDHMSL